MVYLKENLIWFIVFAILPSLVWLVFFLKKDPRPEPKRAILITFFLGAFFSLPTLSLQLFFRESFESNGFLKNTGLILLFLAAIEEIAKFTAVRIWAARKSFFDEKSDPFLYMATSALGFAAAENFLIILTGFNYNISPFSSLFFRSLFLTSLFRFLGPTLLHCFSSGFWGYLWAYSILLGRKTIFLLGLVGAISLHSLFNSCIILLGKNSIFFVFFFFAIVLVFVRSIYQFSLKKNY